MNESDCHFVPKIHACFDGDASPADQAAVESHLETCPSCRHELDALRQMSQLFRQTPWPTLTETQLASLTQRQTPTTLTPIVILLRRISVAAALILAGGISWLIARPDHTAGSASVPNPSLPGVTALQNHPALNPQPDKPAEMQFAQWILQDLRNEN